MLHSFNRPGTLLAACLLAGAVAAAAESPDVNEPNDGPHSATDLACGATLSALAIEPAGDVDFYRLTLDEPTAIDVDVDGHDLAHTRDLVLVLRDENGETIAQDDDGLGPGDRSSALDPYLEPRALDAGTYWIGVAGYPDTELTGGSAERGPYSLTVGCTPTYGCASSRETACFDRVPGDHRYQVEVTYQTTQNGGQSGNAGATPLASLGIGQGGVFHFFDQRNPEILVKVLDGCSTNGYVWVFYAATTNVGFEVEVSDLKTEAQRIYTNPDLTSASTVLDTKAFRCSG